VKLTHALGRPLTEVGDGDVMDPEPVLSQLNHYFELMVPLYIGVAITLVTSGHRTTVESYVSGRRSLAARASIHVPCGLLAPSHPESSLTLRAGAVGAFTQLANDLGRLPGAAEHDVVLDQHLARLDLDPASSLSAFSTVNQAIGVLLAAGFDVTDARAELTARADRTGLDLLTVAGLVLEPTARRETG
jgi:hypothetical protein